jgi:DNA repair exonuclease SbcCD ATPase subunit
VLAKNSQVIADADNYLSTAKDAIKKKEKLETERKHSIAIFLAKTNQFNTDEKEYIAKINDLTYEVDKLLKSVRLLTDEKTKMKDRITKLKNKRGVVNMDQKQCSLCSKEFLEKENFNWSCRTHKSEWSGEMWWCCGKTSKGAHGCGVSKHH